MKDKYRIIELVVIILAALIFSAQQVTSQPYYRDWRGLSPAATTSITNNASATAATVTLTQPSSRVTINVPTGSSIEYITVNGTATTSNFAIQPGQMFQYVGFPAISSFSIVSAASPTGTYSVFAQ